MYNAPGIVMFLANLTIKRDPEIHKHINEKSIRKVKQMGRRIPLRSGEDIFGGIQRFRPEAPILLGCAQYENASLKVGASGPAAQEFETLLADLTLLTLDTPLIPELDRKYNHRPNAE